MTVEARARWDAASYRCPCGFADDDVSEFERHHPGEHPRRGCHRLDPGQRPRHLVRRDRSPVPGRQRGPRPRNLEVQPRRQRRPPRRERAHRRPGRPPRRPALRRGHLRRWLPPRHPRKRPLEQFAGPSRPCASSTAPARQSPSHRSPPQPGSPGHGSTPSPTCAARSRNCAPPRRPAPRRPHASGPAIHPSAPGSPSPSTATGSSPRKTPDCGGNSPGPSATSCQHGSNPVTINPAGKDTTTPRTSRPGQCPRRDAAGHSPG